MSKPAVLLVDDAADLRMLFVQALKSKPVEVIACASADEAVNRLEKSKTLPKLIFVDLRMPGMSGEQFIKNLRSDERFKNLKIYIMSGWSNIRLVAKQIGADGHLSKPFDLGEIDQIIDRELLSF